MISLIGGGYQATADLIDNSVTALLTDPGQLELVATQDIDLDDLTHRGGRADPRRIRRGRP